MTRQPTPPASPRVPQPMEPGGAGLHPSAGELARQTEEARALARELAETNAALHEANVGLGSALAAARSSEERYRALVETNTLMVWRTDASGQVEDLPFWRELTGQTPAQVRGDGWTSAIHPDDAAHTVRVWREALASRRPYESQYRVRLRDGSYRWYRARAVPLLHSDGTVREWVGVFNEIDRMVRREEGMRFLAEASAALTETLDEVATLETLAKLATEYLADGAMITLVREDGRFEHVTTRSRDGVTAAYAAETERMYPLPPGASSGYPRAIRTAEPELIPPGAFDEGILPDVAADALHLERLRKLDMYSGMVVPLVARGATFGAITLVLHGPGRRRPFDATDLALATELGRRAALALDNSRLFSGERAARADAERSAELTRRLQEITASFARALEVDGVARTTLSQGLDALSASAGLVYIMNEQGTALDLVHRHGLPDAAVLPFAHLGLDAPMPVADAVRSGGAVYVGQRADAIEQYPEAAAANRFVASEAWVAVPLVYGGRTLGAVALGFEGRRDFSHEDRALVDALGRHCAQAMERARLWGAERDARDDAERANRAKSDLLAKVSHETRQPVHASVGWVETMEMGLQGPITEAQREALRRIRQNQGRLLTVLNDLLDMSRIEAGKLDLRVEPVAVAAVVDEVESAVTPQMREKSIAYDFRRPAPELVVRADRILLVGILTNLLSNAAKFTPAGGEVIVACHADQSWVRLAVIDSGIGIPAELHERVFEPFYQVERGLTRTSSGTGLGLSISRESARAMGGELALESRGEGGCVFTVRLPRG